VALVTYTTASLLFPAKETFLDEDSFNDSAIESLDDDKGKTETAP
jgi:hypothetical protein